MSQLKYYKESFILLRTVIEKYFFFWLMFEGKKFRHPMTYNIIRKTSKTDIEARDATLLMWKKMWRDGDVNFHDVISLEPGRNESTIKVVFEFEGVKVLQNNIPTGEIIPIYNRILEEYKPDIAHIGELNSVTGNTPLRSGSDKTIFKHKTIYHNFFYIDNLLRNLRINNLINPKQLEKIKVHYNFLSKYVHVGIDSLKIWRDREYFFHQTVNQSRFSNGAYSNLIILYVLKLFHLYLKVILQGYSQSASPDEYAKYNSIVKELELLSKDLWFFDNEPTDYDIMNGKYYMQIGRQTEEKTADLPYYNNPLERMEKLLAYSGKVDN